MLWGTFSPQELWTGKSDLSVIFLGVIELGFRGHSSSIMWKELTCFLVGALKLAGKPRPAVAAPVNRSLELQDQPLAAQYFWWEASLILAPQPAETWTVWLLGFFVLFCLLVFVCLWFCLVFFDGQALPVWQQVSWESRAFSASWEVKPCSGGQAVHIINHRTDLWGCGWAACLWDGKESRVWGWLHCHM